MSGDLTPERLDAILDGREPATSDEERALLELAASLREASPGAGTDLRARVRALATEVPAGRLRPLRAASWRRRAMLAAPALAAVAAAAVAVGVLTDRGSHRGASTVASPPATTVADQALRGAQPEAAHGTSGAGGMSDASAFRTAPRAVEVEVRVQDVDAAVARARGIVVAAGGTVTSETPVQSPSDGVRLSVAIPSARAADAIDRLATLGTAPRGTETVPTGSASVAVDVLVVRSP